MLRWNWFRVLIDVQARTIIFSRFCLTVFQSLAPLLWPCKHFCEQLISHKHVKLVNKLALIQVTLQLFYKKLQWGRGGGRVVSVLSFSSDCPISNPAEVFKYFLLRLIGKNENKQQLRLARLLPFEVMRLAFCWLEWGSMRIGDPSKSPWGVSGVYKKQ